METDLLAGGRIYLRDPTSGEHTVFDAQTTELLAAHQAHYHFPGIARHFLDHGGVVLVLRPDGSRCWGRVSHHYSHLCVATSDGVSVAGVTNLFAVGDAAGTGHWSGHQVRFPGVALAGCLVTAKLAQQHVACAGLADGEVSWTSCEDGHEQRVDRRVLRRQENRLRAINTEALLGYQFGVHPREAAQRWLDQLVALPRRSTNTARDLDELSMLTALACRRVSAGESEPVALGQAKVAPLFAGASER